MRLVPVAEIEKLVNNALLANLVSETNAASVAKALVSAEVDGHKGHGLSRLLAYAAQARAKKVNGMAEPRVEKRALALLAVDAQDGFAFPAIDHAIDALVERVPETGVAMATIFHSHHAGQLGSHVERLAEHGLVALMFSNTPKAMAPWGGTKPLLGTNPIAFATPRKDKMPLVIDLSLSKIARGKVMAAAKTGGAIPEGCALDADGNTTTDPDAALVGSMVPVGKAKGSALALMVEIIAATMTGANQSYESSTFFNDEGPPPGVGQNLIAMDPLKSSGGNFGERLEKLLDTVTGMDGVRLPGSRRMDLREKAARDGLLVPNAMFREVESLANRTGTDVLAKNELS